MTAGTCRLPDLPPGARALVLSVCADGAPATARRLEDLGFAPGTTVQVLRRAPLGDPAVYRVLGSDISLRRRDAARVLVEAIS